MPVLGNYTLYGYEKTKTMYFCKRFISTFYIYENWNY
ncbi:hypothetical protein M2459_000685 [Parabacteroides sp. PF5-5]|nr:hypothetical protein [Parabacteroides sp. PH5-39]MDH6314704.1 hypothetical protein [Parabacteroides sp. PF5-13]MDH6318041.1 hypothetical protein [Parabacteroides sp. PH5-13]MDH6322028.1 hypothetical protein [Parabacteroides sp. PH5-8]MDH6326151.1 hypothetical protein [Parabacteroides sp. PH5-41]MDH6333951.1 hypothetical protein [Parabacteroides sp. PF5-5]MDH6345016.1 hypothetical protein [Parabacteroides sp. PH5-46]MDH6359714.1 hypothetical protein [Parabacteroides sp. PH5-16]MDH6375381.